MIRKMISIHSSGYYRLNGFSALLVLFLLILLAQQVQGQTDHPKYTLRLSVPIIDYPPNATFQGAYPSMDQALLWGNNFYELSFWGIEEMGNSLFKSDRNSLTNKTFKYAVSLGFSKYGSELPIPLGIWTHEEFHRTVLGINGIGSKNGNWILNRWDGTVYGVSDENFSVLKETNLEALLYSYVAGVQSEVLYTQHNVVQDFQHKREFYKNAFYLYNAYYVWNYFKFSTSASSDSLKVIAPAHEGHSSVERDFAGADLTAWAYDMFNPNLPFSNRDDFPNGEGENRRIGFSDLSPEAQVYLKNQKKLSLLNFINPAIFFINRINLGRNFSFNAIMQYAPTHFGNDLALVVPFNLKGREYLVKFHNYNNRTESFWGVDFGRAGIHVSKTFQTSIMIHTWIQPEDQDFFATSGKVGGALEVMTQHKLSRSVSGFVSLTAKTKGWMIGSPFIRESINGSLGLNYNWSKN